MGLVAIVANNSRPTPHVVVVVSRGCEVQRASLAGRRYVRDVAYSSPSAACLVFVR